MRPIIINNVLRSARTLGDACEKFRTFCIDGVDVDEARITDYVHRSLVLVTHCRRSSGTTRYRPSRTTPTGPVAVCANRHLHPGFHREDSDRNVVPEDMVGLF
ncbi:hypothetical protein PDG61_20560 [Mycolicibacterium sp. BiH015]|nr:hypothetical protein [Mycolicibacterium sp. BiH015]MDA2893321.1 hypothetical protein [Mycolicibacterium sp. BiH015]